MIIHFDLNGCAREEQVHAGENVQKLLFKLGMHSVRNSDDGFGFAGSDAILFNGKIVNASLLIAAQLEGEKSSPLNHWVSGISSAWSNKQWSMSVSCNRVITILLPH